MVLNRLALAPVAFSLLAVAALSAGAQPDAPAQATPTLPPGGVYASVTRVVDGDTFHVSIGGLDHTVRYIGVNTPEITFGKNEPLGKEAKNYNAKLVDGQTVYLVKDVSETDKYGRLLRYVFVGSVFVNAELVKQGYAQAATYPPDVAYQQLFLQLQREARTAGRGLWGGATASATSASSVKPTVTVRRPASTRTPLPILPVVPVIVPTQPPAAGAPANCDPAYPSVCIPPAPPDLNCGDISYEEITWKGKALAAAIRGLQALDSADVGISATERRLRSQLIRDYQQQLRAIIADAPPEVAAEILSAGLPDLRLPVNEPSAN